VSDSLYTPGTLIKSRLKDERLILWPSFRTTTPDDESGRVAPDEVMVILKTKKPTKKDKNLADEWQKGSYLVLTSSGVSGWVGEGWVLLVDQE
jgi:hypothetical protein